MADNGFAKAQADYDAQMPPEDELAPIPTRVLRAVVYLTYDGSDAEGEDDEGIEGEASPASMAQDIQRVLTPMTGFGELKRSRMVYPADSIAVTDAEWMSPEEADNYGVPADVRVAVDRGLK